MAEQTTAPDYVYVVTYGDVVAGVLSNEEAAQECADLLYTTMQPRHINITRRVVYDYGYGPRNEAWRWRQVMERRGVDVEALAGRRDADTVSGG